MIKNGRREGNNHRGRLDIIADILGASRGGVRRTYLMYECNLSFRQLKSYSRFLIRQGLLRQLTEGESSRNRSLQVTEKGREFLKAYAGLKSLMQ
ncbi:MAG TPA: winged helix-turn-helix domain-containing protein [Candidatus Acidoferrum sp.]|nr:winged helix-turn-helix domain-containing protein [Candidatus Acidoferrum sp.]